MAATGYNPARSRTDPNKLAAFIQAPLTGVLTEIPGLGVETAKLLKENGISTTYQLFGQFLLLKDEGVESVGTAPSCPLSVTLYSCPSSQPFLRTL